MLCRFLLPDPIRLCKNPVLHIISSSQIRPRGFPTRADFPEKKPAKTNYFPYFLFLSEFGKLSAFPDDSPAYDCRPPLPGVPLDYEFLSTFFLFSCIITEEI